MILNNEFTYLFLEPSTSSYQTPPKEPPSYDDDGEKTYEGKL